MKSENDRVDFKLKLVVEIPILCGLLFQPHLKFRIVNIYLQI